MTRTNGDYYKNGRLMDGYDYERQAWVLGSRYQRCGHPASMNCQCYGRLHENEETEVTQ